MKALYDAIFEHWYAAGAPLSLVSLENTMADRGIGDDSPYVVVQLVVGDVKDWATGGHFTEEWTIQFNLFHKDPDMSELLEIYAALISAFDLATLTIEGYTFLTCTRPPGSTRQTRDEKTWQINVMYDIEARVL